MTPEMPEPEIELWDVVLCDCPELPRMTWTRGGRIVRRFEMTEQRDGERDALDFLASGADAFVVDCPRCGLVLVRGRAPLN